MPVLERGPLKAMEMEGESYLSQLRLLLEELCCELCRFEHVKKDGLAPDSIRIDREVYLGTPGAFADIRVAVPDKRPYFVEIKYGYNDEALVKHLHRKYGGEANAFADATKVVVVLDCENRLNWNSLQVELSGVLRNGLELEVWNEQRLLGKLGDEFGVTIQTISESNLLDVRQAIDRAKGYYAFGGKSFAEYEHEPLKAELLWHFGFWRLRQTREARNYSTRELLPPGLYPRVAVLIADLCSFSSYVRDTPDNEIIRQSLTSFYSKARYQIINRGGMLYQFVGDEVIGLFGVPEHYPSYLERALETAQSLIDIGNSVSNHWQRQIDRIQASSGVHIGMSLGDVEVISLRPFSRTRMGGIGDSINMAARLCSVSGPSEIVVSNSLYRELRDEGNTREFQEIEPVEARNVGRIKAWKLKNPYGERPR